jgi:arylsulfatase A-like enzyme
MSGQQPPAPTRTHPTRPQPNPGTGKKPNILVIMGDDIGIGNVSLYTAGIQGFLTKNIDRIGKEGAILSHAYGQQSCTAGRIAFATGQCPFRVGMTAIGMAGSPDGIPQWVPTIGDMLKLEGYRTGQFGKNHFGDMNEHLPTVHGFDEFFGNLYHLNTSDEPENPDYPKDPAFFAKYGPRGVMDCYARDDEDPNSDNSTRFGPVGKQTVTDTGPLDRKRMETFDLEVLDRSLAFIDDAVKNDAPFFCWHNPSRCHVWTRLRPDSQGKSGAGLYGDGMLEHDNDVGTLLDKLDELGITENTIVIYTTDNGVEKAAWPDGGSGPFFGEKGSAEEGGFRIPFLIRWPGVVEPGSMEVNTFSLEDCLPTLLHAAGNSDVVEQLKAGGVQNPRLADGFKAHLDGFTWLPYWEGKGQGGALDALPPRESFIYFGQNGNLAAVRWKNFKAAFTRTEGNMFTGVSHTPAAPTLFDLYADPYQVMDVEGGAYNIWYGMHMFLFAKFGEVIAAFIETLQDAPNNFSAISSFKPQDLNYDTVKLLHVLTTLKNFKTYYRDPFQ